MSNDEHRQDYLNQDVRSTPVIHAGQRRARYLDLLNHVTHKIGWADASQAKAPGELTTEDRWALLEVNAEFGGAYVTLHPTIEAAEAFILSEQEPKGGWRTRYLLNLATGSRLVPTPRIGWNPYEQETL